MAWWFAAWADALVDEGLLDVTIAGKPILLVRHAGQLHAVDGRCPHARAPLSKGAVCNGRIVCPWHMATFALDTGALVEPPAMRGLTAYPIEQRGRELWVDTDAPTIDDVSAPDGALSLGDQRLFALVGAGAAAAMAATTLRECGYTGRIVTVEQHDEEPVDRTLLTKQALAGQWDMATLGLWSDQDSSGLRVERIRGRAVHIDAAGRRIGLADGRSVQYDAALVATGGEPLPLNVPGTTLAGIHTIRHRADTLALLDASDGATAAVVIGTSFIGMEAAASLRETGLDVTVLGRPGMPFAKQFGEQVGQAILRLHQARGVQFRLGETPVRFDGTGRVEAVALRDGQRLPAQLVVIGTGVTPATAFVDGVDKDHDGAILVDETLRAADGLWAAGDIARIRGGLPRIEHWRLAQQHGRVAAMNMAGRPTPWHGVPFFWSAQHGKRLDYLGHADTWDELAIDGDLNGFDFIAWYVKDGHVAAILSCGRETQTAFLAELLRQPNTLAAARDALAAMAR